MNARTSQRSASGATMIATAIVCAGVTNGQTTWNDVLEYNARNRASVHALEMTELVDTRTRPREGAADPARQALTRAILEGRESSLTAARRDGKPDSELRRIVAEYDSRLGAIDSALLIGNLNKLVTVRRTWKIDFAAQRARSDSTDLRDIPTLMEKHGIDPMQRMVLDQTVTILHSGGRSISLHADPKLAIQRDKPGFDADKLLAYLGVIPSWIERGVVNRIERATLEDRPVIRASGTLPQRGGERFTIELNPSLDMRVAGLRTSDEKGEVTWELKLGEYRSFDGTPIPTSTREQRAGYDLPDYFVERRTVDAVTVNPALSPDDFAVPPEYRLQDQTTVQRATASEKP